jgi:hypothetical protein
VTISDEAILEAVRLADAFEPKQHFPHKGIDVLSRAISAQVLEHPTGNITLDASMVRASFMRFKGMTEASMTLELALREEIARERVVLREGARRAGVADYLTARGVPADRMDATTQDVIRRWELLTEPERSVFLSHDEPAERAGLIPNRFIERNASAIGLSGTPPPPRAPLRVVPGVSTTPRDTTGPRVAAEPATASAPPPAAAAASLDPTSHFTDADFEDMLTSRYRDFLILNADGSPNSNFRDSVTHLAAIARARWAADLAHPMVTVNGHMFPREDFIKDVMTEAADHLAATGDSRAAGFRSIYEKGLDPLGERRGVDSLPDSLRESGRRFRELVARR